MAISKVCPLISVPSFVQNACCAAKEIVTKVGHVAKRCIQSPLFHITCAAIAITATAPFVPFFIVAAALGLTGAYAYVNRKRLLYEVSILPTIFQCHFQKYPWSHAILDGKLRLSAIPLKNYDHHDGEGAKRSIVTMLEAHELKMSLFSAPVLPDDWKAKNVQQKVFAASDFRGVALDHLKEAVAFVHQEIERGQEVTVHCKAGRGRSAAVVIAYLLTHGKLHGVDLKTVDEAITYVKTKRSCISINSGQRRAIDAYHRSL